jgi:hypothetical protein
MINKTPSRNALLHSWEEMDYKKNNMSTDRENGRGNKIIRASVTRGRVHFILWEEYIEIVLKIYLIMQRWKAVKITDTQSEENNI